eukprot:4744386-Alexandrium_andersonii.AAC.1
MPWRWCHFRVSGPRRGCHWRTVVWPRSDLPPCRALRSRSVWAAASRCGTALERPTTGVLPQVLVPRGLAVVSPVLWVVPVR